MTEGRQKVGEVAKIKMCGERDADRRKTTRVEEGSRNCNSEGLIKKQVAANRACVAGLP